jgi:hypothetical protein
LNAPLAASGFHCLQLRLLGQTERSFLACHFAAHNLFLSNDTRICIEFGARDDAIILGIICFGLEGSFRVGAVRLSANGLLLEGARSPSGKAKVCKTFIGGSIPPRASNSPFHICHPGCAEFPKLRKGKRQDCLSP